MDREYEFTLVGARMLYVSRQKHISLKLARQCLELVTGRTGPPATDREVIAWLESILHCDDHGRSRYLVVVVAQEDVEQIACLVSGRYQLSEAPDGYPQVELEQMQLFAALSLSCRPQVLKAVFEHTMHDVLRAQTYRYGSTNQPLVSFAKGAEPPRMFAQHAHGFVEVRGPWGE